MKKEDLIYLKELICKHGMNNISDKEYEVLCVNGHYFGAGQHYFCDETRYHEIGFHKFGIWDVENWEVTQLVLKQLNRYLNLLVKQHCKQDLEKIEIPITAGVFYEAGCDENYGQVTPLESRRARNILDQYVMLGFLEPKIQYANYTQRLDCCFALSTINRNYAAENYTEIQFPTNNKRAGEILYPIVKYDQFVSLLAEDGFILEGMESFEIIKEQWQNGVDVRSSIELDFAKKEEKQPTKNISIGHK